MKFEIKNNKIYRKGEEIKPDTSGTNGKVVSGMSAHGLWFQLQQVPKNYNLQKGHHWPCPKRPRSFYELYNLKKQQKGR